MVLIGKVILLNITLIFFFFQIGKFFKFLKLNVFKSILFGYSIFIFLNYYFYFLFKIELSKIFVFWIIIFFIFLTKNIAKNFKDKNFFLIGKPEIYLIIIISLIYTIPASLYGEQFYVFRGNHWDLFSYLSIASMFSDYNFSIFNETENFPKEYKHFVGIDQLIFSRPLTSLLIGLIIKGVDMNIFLISYIIKIIFIILATFSFKQLIENLNYSKFNKILLSFIFSISFWIIYIFEIDAFSHLASIPIFLIVISELKNTHKFEQFNIKFLFYIGFLNAALFLIYPELFCVSSIIYSLYFLEKIIFSKQKIIFIKSIFLIFLIFLILTLPSFKTNYIFLFGQLKSTVTQSKDWWGYFGAFILGKENLVQNQIYISQIKDYFINHNIIETLKYIIGLHFETGYRFFYLNIMPSFFGLYFISVGKIDSFFDWLNTIFLIAVNIYLLHISFKNFKILKRNPLVLLSLIFFFLISIFLIIKGNLWAVIKLYSYLSPFILIFIITDFHIIEKKNYLKVNYLIVFFLLLFPIYKYSSYNNGIGRLDSFPSIMHPKMKKDFIWKLEVTDIKQCSYVYVEINDYFKKSYLLLKFLENSINSNLANNKDINLGKKCYLVNENKNFKILFDYNENRSDNL